MPTRTKFFDKPERVGEIVGNRRLMPHTDETLVEVIDSLKPGQAVVIDYQIIPDTDPISGIPYWKEEDQRLKSMRFLKRGPQTDVMKWRSLDEAMEAADKPYADRQRRFAGLNGTPMSGYGWWGARLRQHKKVHLTDCIEGARIFAYSELNKHDEDRTITMREYSDDQKRQMGGDFLLEVPSADEDIKHDVALVSVPLTRDRTKYARVKDLHSAQSCKATTKRVSKRYAGREHYWCKHAIAAYLHVAKSEFEKGNPNPLDMSPFALPTQRTVDFYNKLTHRVMMQEKYLDEEGKERTKKRPLNKAEREIMLWRLVSKYGPKETLFARGKLQEYKWNRIYAPAA